MRRYAMLMTFQIRAPQLAVGPMCKSQFCDLERRGASLHLHLSMDTLVTLAREAEVDDVELEGQSDALGEDLLVLSGHLKQAGFDVTPMLNHLLNAPAL